MIKYILLTLCLLSPVLVFSQDKNSIESNKDSQLKVEQSSDFSTCHKLKIVLQKKCYLNKLKKHIVENFNSNFVPYLELKSGKSDLILAFTISNDGKIINIKARAENDKIQSIAPQLLESLPKSSLDDHFENLWGVNYTLPVTLNIDK